MQHTKPFKDPFRPKQKPLSDEARDRWDEIFGNHVLPNEKDHLESFILTEKGDKFDIGSASKPIEKKEEEPKHRIVAPGEVHRVDIPFMNPQALQQIMKDIVSKNFDENKTNDTA